MSDTYQGEDRRASQMQVDLLSESHLRISEKLDRLNDSITKLQTDLPRIEEKLEEKILNFVAQREDIKDRLKDLDTRIGVLERWFWKVTGAISVLTFLAPYIIDKIKGMW